MNVGGATAAPATARGHAEEQRLNEAAQAFESLFVQMLIERMQDAQLEEGFFGQSTGSSVYEGMFNQYLGERLTTESPLGIASMLLRQWSGSADGGSEAEAALRQVRAGKVYDGVVEAAGRPAGAASGSAAATVRPAGRERVEGGVSRGFGWGTDPIDGSHRFHGGVDLPAAVGTPVLAVAPGRVATVERHAGYGLQVIVRHGDGWSTRYAHLEAADVRVGQWLVRGMELGKVGNSGRSTGPHLHFEALQGKRKVDPAVAAPGPIRAQVLGRPADQNHVSTKGFTRPED